MTDRIGGSPQSRASESGSSPRFFEIEEEYRQTYFDMPLVEQTGRIVLRARAVERTDPNIAFPERELERFDLNRYE